MTNYEFIDWPNKKKRHFMSFGDDENIEFVCEKCFRTFKHLVLDHLGKCNLEWPSEECGPPRAGSKYPKYMIYAISKKKNRLTKKIIKIVENLSWFSKMEQGIDTRQVVSGLIGKRFSWNLSSDEHILYVEFFYKNIVSYCLVHYFPRSILSGRKKYVIIRDLFTIPSYRNKSYASRILHSISKDYGIPISSILFSNPVTDKTKHLLRSLKIFKIKTIQGENFSTIKEFSI